MTGSRRSSEAPRAAAPAKRSRARRSPRFAGNRTRRTGSVTENGHRFLAFPDAEALGTWLAEHHAAASEVWVRIYKAGSGRPSVTWTDCVIEAIRFGWIDGQKLP